MTVQRRFEARLAGLAAVQDFAEGLCAAAGLEQRVALRLALVLEELFTNTVIHGHGGDCDEPVLIALTCDAEGVSVVYADRAPPFDPIAHVELTRRALEAPAEERPIGKLGLVLVLDYAREARYAREDGWNRLSLRVA